MTKQVPVMWCWNIPAGYNLLPISVIYSWLYLVATRVQKYDNKYALIVSHTFLTLKYRPATKNTKMEALYPKHNSQVIKSGDIWTHSSNGSHPIAMNLGLSTSPTPAVRMAVQCASYHKLDGQQTWVAAHILIRSCSHNMTVNKGPLFISAIRKPKVTPCWPTTQVS